MSTTSSSSGNTSMRAIGVSTYGPVENLQSRQIPRPPRPTGRQMLVRTRGVSVNPIDVKVRGGVYDDAPDYYERVGQLTRDEPHLHVMGYDGAGVVAEVGPGVRHFAPGDEVFHLGDPAGQGCYAEEVLVDERHAGRRPRGLDSVQAAAMPLTYGTAYEALVGRLEIGEGERAGVLIVNGGGGVGSVASQIARRVLGLPVVITTASRRETEGFSRGMGATHVVNHRGDIVRQIRELDLPEGVPLKYAFITSRTEQYIQPISDVLAPFGKVCSIVQAKFDMYGSQFMSKSLTFSWCWLGSGGYHYYVNDDDEKHHRWFEELARLLDEGTLKCHLTRRLKLTLEGLKEAHREIEGGKGIGKIGLGIDEDGPGEPFT
ncbi:hypothetical protein VPNG_01908 [Cytospora leucostoma]|uniref:Enoyl reductase (ER) domain-containing protein n=1 Tax=Cytospora leucostoma TaxID=1230097 RepID=A0A423XI80_9PEZI|nr:hypothetical protein VPNG_01908 [Cytospora leucostoma]